MGCRYWKAVCKYGHVGFGKEVSVARYLKTKDSFSIVDARNIAMQMPGVKANGVLTIAPIDEITYLLGKQTEKSNFYILALKNHKHHRTNMKGA